MGKEDSKPKFVREESWRYLRVKRSWRAPKGKSSRVRRSKKGWPAVVKIGYAKPTRSKGVHPSGLREVLVWNAKDLEKIDPKTQAGRIGHTVGEKKRSLIMDEAKKANIRILNPGLKKTTEPEVEPEQIKTEDTEKGEQETSRSSGKEEEEK